MRPMPHVLAALLILGWFGQGSAAADPIVIGSVIGSGSCVPFGCSVVTRYQQAYDAASFPGIVALSGFTFFNVINNGFGDRSLDPAFYELRLTTTARGIHALSPSFDTNLGADLQLVFAGELSGDVIPPDGQLSFTLPAPFTYDPAAGNLLLDVRKIGGRQFGDDGAFLDYNEDRSVAAAIFDLDGVFVNNSNGLVTGFAVDAVPTPEPATLGLFGLGGAAMAIRRRVRRQSPRT